MSTNADNRKFRQGLSLVEAMVAIFVITAGIVGTFGYSCRAMLQTRKATEQNTAAQIAELLCESWKGLKGTETFEPTVYFSPSLINKVSNVSSCRFSQIGTSVQMLLALNNGSQTATAVTSAVMHN